MRIADVSDEAGDISVMTHSINKGSDSVTVSTPDDLLLVVL